MPDIAVEQAERAPTPGKFIDTTFQRRLKQREALAGINPATELKTPEDRTEQYKRLEYMIGHTPLLLVHEEPNGSTVLAKVESHNPSESHYDRAYLATLRRLEEDGVIQPGDELLEITSGSAGTSFAWLCNRLGYQARIIVPPELPNGRVQEMINFGAIVERSQPGYVPEAAIEMRDEIMKHKDTRERHYTDDYKVITYQKEDGKRVCVVNHSANRLTPDAFKEIGEEVVGVIPEDAKIDFAVSVLGNWTSTTGLSESLRAHYPDVKMIGIEDVRNPNYFEEKYPGEYEKRFGVPPEFGQHDSYGASARGVKLDFVDVDSLDEIVLIDPKDRDEVGAKYNKEHPNIVETIGNTSAASLWEAEQLAKEHPGSVVLVIFYDKADRYGEPVQTRQSDTYMTLGGTNTVRERARIPDPGWNQRRVKSLRELPTSLVEFTAGGKSRAYESWALS